MSRILRRLYSTASTSLPSASSVATQFLKTSQSFPPQASTVVLTPTPLSHLLATLDRPLPSAPAEGAPLPPAYHLAYFAPSQPTATLGLDGTDTAYNPDAPFTRRMWAGGELTWTGKENLLRVGQTVSETTRVLSAEAKRTKAGEEMVVVGVEKVLANEEGVALTDKRNWVFRPAITAPQPPPARKASVPFPQAAHSRTFTQTPTTLFRFSAITFNAHKIHYNAAWCREVEGHRDLVVHGPLNLVNMVDFWRDVVGKGLDRALVPKRVTYRATHPVYVGEEYRVLMELDEAEKIAQVRIVDGAGNICMKGEIEAF